MTKLDLTSIMLESYLNSEISFEEIGESLSEGLLDADFINIVFECADEILSGNISRFTNVALVEAYKSSLIDDDLFSSLVESGIINLNMSMTLMESVELEESVMKKIGKAASRVALAGALTTAAGGSAATIASALGVAAGHYFGKPEMQRQIAQNLNDHQQKKQQAEKEKKLAYDAKKEGQTVAGQAKNIANHVAKNMADSNIPVVRDVGSYIDNKIYSPKEKQEFHTNNHKNLTNDAQKSLKMAQNIHKDIENPVTQFQYAKQPILDYLTNKLQSPKK